MGRELTRICSGIPGLDEVLNGGFIEGASYIVQGHPGAGKTIFSNQVAFAQLAAGRRVLYVTLLAETHDRLFQSLSTLDFFDPQKVGDTISYLSVFQTLRDEGLEAVVKLLREEIRRQHASLLVFDGLLNARDRAETELDVKTFIAEVQSQAAFVGCTVLFLTSTRNQYISPEHTMVDGVIDLCGEVAGARAIRRLQVIKSRGSKSIGGLHLYEIRSNGITVYPRLEALESPLEGSLADLGRCTTGIQGLDGLIEGGFPSGSVTLVVGPTGSGKTTLGLNFVSAAGEAEPALFVGFYETPARLHLKAKSLDISLPDSDSLKILWNPLAENLLDKLAHQLLDSVRATGAKRLFIDGLGGFERAAVEPKRLVEFFAALTNELRSLGVTTVATWELRTMFGSHTEAPSPEVSSLLDNLIMVRQVEVQSRMLRVLAVLKMRDSKLEPALHEFTIDSGGMQIGAPLEPMEGAITGLARLDGR